MHERDESEQGATERLFRMAMPFLAVINVFYGVQAVATGDHAMGLIHLSLAGALTWLWFFEDTV